MYLKICWICGVKILTHIYYPPQKHKILRPAQYIVLNFIFKLLNSNLITHKPSNYDIISPSGINKI